jgi:hypothetical protein
LAAVSVGSSLWMPLMLFMTGTLMGLTPIVAHLLGGQRHDAIRPAVHQALWVGIGPTLRNLAMGRRGAYFRTHGRAVERCKGVRCLP